MNRAMTELEENIKTIISSEVMQKRGIVAELSDIEELNDYSYKELMEFKRQGKVIVRLSPHSAKSHLFSLVSSITKKCFVILLIIIGFFLLTVGMVLSATVSLWFLPSALLFPICLMYVKRFHMQSRYHNAFHSEIIFCYLFCSGYITVQLPDGNISYRTQA